MSAEILKLIETVSPDDTAKLETIDLAVGEFLGLTIKPDGLVYIEGTGYFELPKYTRSRDALKAIRPEGWTFMIDQRDNWTQTTAFEPGYSERGNSGTHFHSPRLPTEELAELHAIIQAIEYERGQK